jgi:hypothetical protein
VPQNVIQEQRGVARIVLRSAVGKRLAVSGQTGGRQREEHQEVVFEECVGNGAAGLLEADGDRPAAEPLAKATGPLVDGFRRVGQLGVLGQAAALIVEHDVVLLVGPIQADKRGEHGGVGRQAR